MSRLEKLRLGAGACDHTIYPRLPASLKQLYIRLPNEPQNVRLVEVADALTRRLTRIQRLEFYSQRYRQPPIEVTHDPVSGGTALQQTQLRELRLSDVRGAPGEITQFLSRLGGNLSTLALHSISDPHQHVLAFCPRLHRLEVSDVSQPYPGACVLPTRTMAALNFLRTGFSVTGEDLHFIRDTLPLLPRLSTLDLTPQGRLDEGGHTVLSDALNDLLQRCQERQIHLLVKGRPATTLEHLWKVVTSG